MSGAGVAVAEEVHVEVRGGIAVLTLDRPPSNALSPSIRRELDFRLNTAFADDEVRGIVLTGAGSGFSAGVDIAEYDRPLTEPWIGDLCRTIEQSDKPVVAALHGAVLGAGFELALAAHARVAQKGTKVSLPELSLGLMPGGGATQRLPRLVGAQVSLEMMLGGRAADVSDKRFRLAFDMITDEPPVEAAIRMAQDMARSGLWTRTRDRDKGLSDHKAYHKAVAEVAEKLADAAGPAGDILASIEAAHLLPFDMGETFEAVRFRDCINAPLARGIRHSFTSEWRARAMPGVDLNALPRIETTAIVGTAPVASELALLGLTLGQTVLLLTAAPSSRIADRITAHFDRMVESGGLTPEARTEFLSRLEAVSDPAELCRAHLVLDCGGVSFETPPPLRPGVIWAVIDGAAPVAGRAAAVGAPGRAAALHVGRPAQTAPLMELAVPNGTEPDVAPALSRHFGRQGRIVLRTVEAPGMLGENMMAALCRAALVIVRAGRSPFEVDVAAQTLGFARGPFRMLDDQGLARGLGRLRRLYEARDLPQDELRLLSDRVEEKSDGTGPVRGFYTVSGTAVLPDQEVNPWLDDWRKSQNGEFPDWPDIAPDLALHAALVNEAGRLIEARAVVRPSDLDVAMVKGYGFDRRKGGPLLQADLVGMLRLIRAMKVLAPLNETLWQPRTQIEDMVKYGRAFFSQG